MSSITLRLLCRAISKTLDIFVYWTFGRISHIFTSSTFYSETYCSELRMKVSKRLRALLPRHVISMIFKLEQLLGVNCPFSIICGQF